MTTILLLAEYDAAFAPHVATEAALGHAGRALGIDVRAEWVSANDITESHVDRCDGLWAAPGSPYANCDNTIAAIRRARERGIPCFGTCGGFQYMVVEYARHVLGYRDARGAFDTDPESGALFISRLACSLVGREMLVTFAAGSQTSRIYGVEACVEQYFCSLGVHPDRVHLFRQGPIRIAGSDEEGEIRVLELPEHPFFVGTLFVPQMRSREDAPHPLVTAFVRAAHASHEIAADSFLRATDVIDWRHPAIRERARLLRGESLDATEIARRTFEWVRDEIRHSADFNLTAVTCAASHVLAERSGYCYAKSHLLAALLRANQIPAGLCYQRLRLDDAGDRFCLHGFNAVLLPDAGWYRLDARGNKPGVDAQFAPPVERLAFTPALAGEVDLPGVHADPLTVVVDTLRRHTTTETLRADLPDAEAVGA